MLRGVPAGSDDGILKSPTLVYREAAHADYNALKFHPPGRNSQA